MSVQSLARLAAAEAVAVDGISVAVASLGGVKPLDTHFLNNMAQRFPCWLSLEEHSIIGGLGSSLLEWLADNKTHQVNLMRLGVPDVFLHELQSELYLSTVGPRCSWAISDYTPGVCALVLCV